MRARSEIRPEGFLEISLYYLNLAIGDDWRADIARPYETEARELSSRQGRLFGIDSGANAQAVLEGFQELAGALMKLDPSSAPASASERVMLLRELAQQAKPTVEGFGVDPDSGRLEVLWGTAEGSFSELLHTTLALALHEAPFWPLARCEACQKFFVKPSDREIKYCTERCRRRREVARYRERKRKRPSGRNKA